MLVAARCTLRRLVHSRSPTSRIWHVRTLSRTPWHVAQVLHKFLEVFSTFDWDTCGLTLGGPVPLSTFSQGVVACVWGMGGLGGGDTKGWGWG